MSFDAPPQQTTEAEAPFGFEDLFFSMTDSRGCIRASNDVFRRIAGYTEDELKGAPHKIIRHPDMPRGVFHLMWDELQNGRAFAGYVKNRSKDGRYYWVFALVSSLPDDGFLSVRVKPASKFFKAAKELYAQLLRREATENLPPADSEAALLAALTAQGFRGYGDFMRRAAAAEAAEMRRALHGDAPVWKADMEGLTAGLDEIRKRAETVFDAFRTMRFAPFNMRAQASRLESGKGPFAVIAETLHELGREIDAAMRAFTEAANMGDERLSEALLMLSAMEMQREMEARFRRAGESNEQDFRIDALEALTARYQDQAAQRLTELTQRLGAFQAAILPVRRLLGAIDLTRVMSKIEDARTPHAGGDLDKIIDRLSASHAEITEALSSIDQNGRRVLTHGAALRGAAEV